MSSSTAVESPLRKGSPIFSYLSKGHELFSSIRERVTSHVRDTAKEHSGISRAFFGLVKGRSLEVASIAKTRHEKAMLSLSLIGLAIILSACTESTPTPSPYDSIPKRVENLPPTTLKYVLTVSSVGVSDEQREKAMGPYYAHLTQNAAQHSTTPKPTPRQ
ncbi:MAG: hypothetical protein WCJ19_01945 [bacterium]